MCLLSISVVLVVVGDDAFFIAVVIVDRDVILEVVFVELGGVVCSGDYFGGHHHLLVLLGHLVCPVDVDIKVHVDVVEVILCDLCVEWLGLSVFNSLILLPLLFLRLLT